MITSFNHRQYYYNEHDSFYMHCKSVFNKNAVILSFRKNENSFKNSRDESLSNEESELAEKSAMIYI